MGSLSPIFGCWDAALLWFYQALICSKLDYYCKVYSFLTPTILRILDSPVESLYVCWEWRPIFFITLGLYEPVLLHETTKDSYIQKGLNFLKIANPLVGKWEFCGRSKFESFQGCSSWNSQFPLCINVFKLDLAGIGKEWDRSEAEIRNRFFDIFASTKNQIQNIQMVRSLKVM